MGGAWVLEQEFDFLGGKFFHRARRDTLEREGADLVAAEALYVVAQRGEEQADLALLAVVHVDVEVGGLCARARVDEGGAFDLEAFALEQDALDEQRQAFRGERILEDDVVAFRDQVRRVGEALREVAVRRQNDEALAVFVEAAGAKKAEFGKLARQHGEDRVGVVRVVVGAGEAPGFVHGERESRLYGRAHAFAAGGHTVDSGRDLLTERGDDAVDPNLALRNECLGGAPRTEAGVGEVFLQAKRFDG